MQEGPIQGNTIITLDTKDGSIIDERGRGLFYMPHGMTIDRMGNTWLTDVALHQVFKVNIFIFFLAKLKGTERIYCGKKILA